MALAGAAAGAGEGLDKALARLLTERELGQKDTQIAETGRHNVADEGLRGQQIAAVERERTSRDNELAQSRNENNVVRRVNLRPIDSVVPDTERAAETKLGIPSGLYSDWQPGNMGMSDPDKGEVPSTLPGVKWRGTQDQQIKAKDSDTRATTAAARAEAAETSAALSGRRADVAEERVKLAQDKADKDAHTVKVGEGGKRSLRSIEQAEPMIDQLMGDIKKAHPDIENPDGTINTKYNTAGDKVTNLAKYAKYWMGMNDPDSPHVQVTKLLQPVASGQYLAGSRSQKMLDLALAHLADPTQTTAEQYDRLRTLKKMFPEMRAGVIRAERPVTVDDSGKEVGSGGGELTYDPKTKTWSKGGD